MICSVSTYLYSAFGCTLLSCHVRFQGKSTLYSFLNVKELLAGNRYNIWSLSDHNGIRTHNYLNHKRTLNHLAELASHFNFRHCTYLEQGLPWHSDSCKVEIHSEKQTWNDNNIRSFYTVCFTCKISSSLTLEISKVIYIFSFLFITNSHPLIFLYIAKSWKKTISIITNQTVIYEKRFYAVSNSL